MKKIERSPMDPFVKWFFPKLLKFVPAGLTANKISVIGITVSFFSGFFLGVSGFIGSIGVSGFIGNITLAKWSYFFGGFLIIITWITDTMDGVVARSRDQQSAVGYYLDHFGDSLNVAFIGAGLFLTNGSHLAIGLACGIIYLLFHVNEHVTVTKLHKMELPVFGPTEIRFMIFALVIAQIFIDFGQPLSWFPEITGAEGWFTKAFGFHSGLTFMDVCGVIAIFLGSIGVAVEMRVKIKKLRVLDKTGKDA